MFTLSVEDGDRDVARAFTLRLGKRRIAIDHRHVLFAVWGTFIVAQLLYYAIYFFRSPQLAVRQFPSPVLFFPIFMGLFLGAQSRTGWMVLRFVSVILGSLIAFGASKRRFRLASLDEWDRFA